MKGREARAEEKAAARPARRGRRRRPQPPLRSSTCERDAAGQRDEPVDSALIRCKSSQRTGSRCYPRSDGRLMVESSAVAFVDRTALRADRTAVRPLSAQCAVRTAAVRCTVRSFSPRSAHENSALRSRTALEKNAVRSIPPQCVHEKRTENPAVRSASTAQGDRSAVESPRTATSPSSRAPPSCFEPPSYVTKFQSGGVVSR